MSEKRKVWEHLYEETNDCQEGFPVSRLKDIIADCLNDDIIEIGTDADDHNSTIYIGRWREETDEEYQKRLNEAKSVSHISGYTSVSVNAQDYVLIQQKAAKYDELCK